MDANIPTITALACGQPSSPSRVEFPALEAKNDHSDYYGFLPPHGVKNEVVIQKRGKDGNHVLDYQGTDAPLDKWLKVNVGESPWCDVCKALPLNEKRPKEMLRKVLRALIREVGRLHKSGRSHGGLRHMGNIYVKVRSDDNSGVWCEGVEVVLLGGGGGGGEGTLLARMKQDIADLEKLIFEDILKVVEEGGELADDLVHLSTVMKTSALPTGNANNFKVCWDLMSDHTGFWHYRTRLHMYGKALAALMNEVGQDRRGVNSLMEEQWLPLCRDGGWKKLIEGKAFFEKVFNEAGVKQYSDDGEDLLRYLRAIAAHAEKVEKEKEGDKGSAKKKKGQEKGKAKKKEKKAYFDVETNPEYLNVQFVEKEIRDTFPRVAIGLQAVMNVFKVKLDDIGS